MSPFEVIMLVCFASGWPFSIIKALRTKEASGKSPAFMVVISVGYLSGIAHKLVYARDWVVALYALTQATHLYLLLKSQRVLGTRSRECSGR